MNCSSGQGMRCLRANTSIFLQNVLPFGRLWCVNRMRSDMHSGISSGNPSDKCREGCRCPFNQSLRPSPDAARPIASSVHRPWFSKDAICSRLFRCSSATVRLSFGLFLFFLDFVIRSFFSPCSSQPITQAERSNLYAKQRRRKICS
jgi:hypothetical protein